MTQLHALSLTLGIEGAVGGLLLWAWLGLRGRTWVRGLLVVLAASLLTHPLAWHANRVWLIGLSFPVRAAIIEGAVVLVEASILALAMRSTGDVPRVRPTAPWTWLVLSLVMNGASFGYGLVRVLVFG
ncbi:MAG: hypothetical protein AB1Z98_31245 [Nannocystaceae bacterium]